MPYLYSNRLSHFYLYNNYILCLDVDESYLYNKEDNFFIAGKLKYWFYHGLEFVKDDKEWCTRSSVFFSSFFSLSVV